MGSTRAKAKVLPAPSALVRVRVPPICSTRAREMLRPRPVPP